VLQVTFLVSRWRDVVEQLPHGASGSLGTAMLVAWLTNMLLHFAGCYIVAYKVPLSRSSQQSIEF
jgi:hypothetical protein